MEIIARAIFPSRHFPFAKPGIYLAGLMIFALSCARSYNPDIERGAEYTYRQGYPEMRMNAVGLFDEQGQPGINLAADIVYGSLVFKNNDSLDVYKANVALDVQIVDRSDKSNIVRTRRYTFTVRKKDKNIVNSQEVFTFEKRIEVPPGDYAVNVTITDMSSQKSITQSARTYLPNPDTEKPNLTNIRLLGKDNEERNGKFIPITTYDVQGKIDSLRFIFQVTHHNPNQRLVINTRLVRFRSDTTAARPMSYNNYSPSSLPYKGIDYDEQTEIQSNRRVLTETGNILIEYRFANVGRGNYRFEAEIQDPGDSENEYKARSFSVKSQNYPALKTPEELARPLVYLMSDKEYKRLMAIQDPDSLKHAIDIFWLKHIQSKSDAKSVISMYYERVEEANKQFSNFKEGWKTDLGMIYVLFGPPWYIEQSLDIMQWSYSYNREDPRYNYTFRKPKMKSEFYPFNNYLLQRHQYYYNVDYQQRQLWLTGGILTRSI